MSQVKSVFLLLVRLVVGGVLIYSGFSKAVGPSAEFAGALAAYRVLPIHWVLPVAMIWPWLELLAGTYLFFGYFTRFFAAIASACFAVFIGVLGSAILRGIDPGSCGCFGTMLTFSTRQAVSLDAVLLFLSLWTTMSTQFPPPLSIDAWIDKPFTKVEV